MVCSDRLIGSATQKFCVCCFATVYRRAKEKCALPKWDTCAVSLGICKIKTKLGACWCDYSTLQQTSQNGTFARVYMTDYNTLTNYMHHWWIVFFFSKFKILGRILVYRERERLPLDQGTTLTLYLEMLSAPPNKLLKMVTKHVCSAQMLRFPVKLSAVLRM